MGQVIQICKVNYFKPLYIEGFLVFNKNELTYNMKQEKIEISYQVFDGIDELNNEDASLLRIANEVTNTAYAPYSNFHVGAAARLTTGEILTGTNQENASYPVGLCAERVLLATISSLHPGVPLEVMAISHHNKNGNSDHPIAPCGMCRQYIQEFENRLNKSFRLILGGLNGKIFVFEKASQLLPIGFTSESME